MFTQNRIAITGEIQQSFAVSAAAAQSIPLSPGTYDVWCDVDCWIKTGFVANGYVVFAGNIISVAIAEVGHRIGAIAGGAGTFRFHKVG